MVNGGLYALVLAGATAPTGAPTPALVTEPGAILAVLLAVLAVIQWLARLRGARRFFGIVPPLLFCYFIPTALTTSGVIPAESRLYDWVRQVLLPASLVLIVLALDVPGVVRLGPKALLMTLTGTAGVIVGAPVALLVGQALLPVDWKLPPDAWKGLAALSGSWIGGGANFLAIAEVVRTPPGLLGTMVIADVAVANLWMGFLLYLSGHQQRADTWLRADAEPIRRLQAQMAAYQQRIARTPSVADVLVILAIAFGASQASEWLARALPELGAMISRTTWKYILATACGVLLSFTPARRLEGAGASQLATAMLYLLVACIGASADFRMIGRAPGFILVGAVWMAVHAGVLLIVGRLVRAPIFLLAVGSQANVGGAVSAPVVAAAYQPALAPVGALLAVLGYVLGTYGGLVCAQLLKLVAGG